MRRGIGRFGGFAVLPLFSLVSPLLLLPVLAREVSTPVWTAVAVGQSVGAVGQLLVGWGWSLVGPAEVARADDAGRRRAVVTSVRCRVVVLLVAVAPLSLAAGALAAPSARIDAAVMAIAIAVTGLAPTWYSIGVGRADLILRFEVVPKTIALVASAALLLAGLPAVCYPALLGTATLAGQALFYAPFLREEGVAPEPLRRALAARAPAALTELLTGAYASSTIALASVGASTGTTAQLAAVDRIYRLGGSAITVTSNALQGHVAAASGADFRRRAWRSVAVHAVIGVVGLGVLALLGRSIARLLFGDQPVPDTAAFVAYGVAFLAVALNTVTGRHVLIPTRGARAVLLGTAAGAVIGVPAILIAGFTDLCPLLAAAFALSEVAVLATQCLALATGARRTR